jgi:hypothetical protein
LPQPAAVAKIICARHMLLRAVAIGHDSLQPFAIPRSEPHFDMSLQSALFTASVRSTTEFDRPAAAILLPRTLEAAILASGVWNVCANVYQDGEETRLR